MANVVIFKPGETPQYLESVNTPDYEGNPDVIINPDMSSVEGVEFKYIKRSGIDVLPMNNSERQAVDDAEKAQKEARVQALSIDAITLAKALVKTGKITKQELVTAIKEVI